MPSLKKLLRPDADAPWLSDLVFLLAPIACFTPYIYFNFVAPPRGYDQADPLYVEGVVDRIGDIAGSVFVLFLGIVFVIALLRLIYRYRHRGRP